MRIKIQQKRGIKFNRRKVYQFFAATVETRIKEPAFITTLRLKFHLLNPLNKNRKEAETGIGSCIMGFLLCNSKVQE